jgi:serine/threonine-protein kinase PpkA
VLLHKLLLGLTVALLVGWSGKMTAQAQTEQRQPLLLTGKTALFQRVLTRPGATLLAQPAGQATRTVPPLSIFYVYDRRTSGAGAAYIEVGTNTIGQVVGWLAADQTIEWKQALVLNFANRAGRERVLFFEDQSSMLDLIEADDASGRLKQVREDIARTGHASNGAVIAQEPKEYVDIRKQFYLLPILQAHEVMLASGFRMNSVEVASVTAREEDPQPIDTERTNNPALADFSAALVFVIDATASMGPFIEAAREVVSSVSERIKESGLSDRMRFGLVGYRDDPQAVPGMEYLTRIFVDPNTVKDGAAFLRQAAALEASDISTRTFVEDGFAGLMAAIDNINWSSFGGRYIVLITDASSRNASDRLGSTGLNAEQVREKALENSIAIYTVHLKTPAGAHDHSRAERQYTVLSDYPNVGSLYYPVDAGSVDRFRTAIDALADAIVTQVEAASRGEFAAGSSVKQMATTDVQAAPKAKAEEDLRQKTALLGYAMQLSYIGRVQGVQAPPLLRAWTVDRDLDHPANQALQVRVLLTKNQLSDLQAALKEIVDVGIATEISRQQFFDQLKSAAATLSRDPSRVGRQGATNLKELGLLGEYLDDLPYRSRVLALSEEMWNRWSIGEQVAFVDDLEAKIRLYQSFHDDVDTWVNLDDGASPGDAVYPVPLSALP